MDKVFDLRAMVRGRIDALRAALHTHGLAAWIVPSADPHLSEYLPERWQGREWASGFTGSAGTLVVTADTAGLWVDSRYWTQADVQTEATGIQVMKIAGSASPGHVEWLAEHLPPGSVVGADGAVLSLAAARTLQEKLGGRDIALRTDLDLLDDVWPQRPGLPAAAVYEHPAPYAPTSRRDKLQRIRDEVGRAGAQAHFVSTLDDIAWITNLRGADLPHNPVFAAHLLITGETAVLFVGEGKIGPALREKLAADGLTLAPYGEAAAALSALPSRSHLLLDPRRITLAFRQAVPETVRVVESINRSTMAKSRKSDAEIAFFRQAMEEDGAALAEFFVYSLAAAWGAGGIRSPNGVELRTTDPRPVQAALLLQSVEEVSELSTGDDQSQPVTITGVDSPALAWLLRNHSVEKVSTLDPQATPPPIITPPMDDLKLTAAYRGQDFIWRQNVQYETMQRPVWWRWLVNRQLPRQDGDHHPVGARRSFPRYKPERAITKTKYITAGVP